MPDCDPLEDDLTNDTWAEPENRVDFEDLTLPAGLPLKLEGGNSFSTALFGDGTLQCWGQNSATDYRSTPPTDGEGTYLDFSAKQQHGAAISTCYADCDGDGYSGPVDFDGPDGDFDCWNGYYVLGDIAADTNGDGSVTSADLDAFMLFDVSDPCN